MSERSTHNCETCTHVATRHFRHWCAWLQPPIGTRGFDDGARGAVLHAVPWLHELGFGKNSAGPFQMRDNSNTGVRPMRLAALPAMRVEFSIVTRFAKTVTTIMIGDDYDRKRP